jgi:hypothetical protein
MSSGDYRATLTFAQRFRDLTARQASADPLIADRMFASPIPAGEQEEILVVICGFRCRKIATVEVKCEQEVDVVTETCTW